MNDIVLTLFLALTGGFLPAIVWLWFWLGEDEKRPEPTGYILQAFLVGGLTVLIAFFLERPLLHVFGEIKGTYIDKILVGLDRDSKLRTFFNITSTTSGRLSSSGKFNAQQIPRDDPIVKGCIVAKPGYKIVSQDWLQVPSSSNTGINIPQIAGNPLSSDNYKVVGNDELESLKILEIGQSAAKSPEDGLTFRDYPKGVGYGR